MKETLSSFSNSLERDRPGGVRNTPSRFGGRSFSSVTSSGLGKGWLGFSGMNTRLDSKFLRNFGGR